VSGFTQEWILELSLKRKGRDSRFCFIKVRKWLLSGFCYVGVDNRQIFIPPHTECVAILCCMANLTFMSKFKTLIPAKTKPIKYYTKIKRVIFDDL